MLSVLRRTKDTKAAARRLYAGVVAQARDPAFFTRLDVSDSTDGRFDLICLHAWLVLEQIEGNRALAQAFVNEVFAGFDDALRQSGTGDVGMNRRLKTLASAFYGRLEAYRAAPGAEELAEAILRNLFRGAAEKKAVAEGLATYALATRSGFTKEDLAEGHLSFAPIPWI
jgi:cytochrome b pre-mRNA-processing protein 3